MPVLSAYENVELPLLLNGVNPKERRDRVMRRLKPWACPIGSTTGPTS